jgi:hypothetical protein
MRFTVSLHYLGGAGERGGLLLIGYCSEDVNFPSFHFIIPPRLFILHSLLFGPHSKCKQKNCVLYDNI